MNNKRIALISIIFNIIFLSGALFLGYKYYPKIKSKFFSEKLTVIQETKLKESNKVPIIYYDASKFKIIGRLPNVSNYERLPLSAKNKVREPVWNLAKNSAGISIRFSSNSSIIKIKWKLKNNGNISNISPIAVKGLDLYAYNNNKWQFVGGAEPTGSFENEDIIIKGMDNINREYLLNLPLYDEVEQLEIGVDKDALIQKPFINIIDTSRPIVFYGTSITQGASASRPGLAYSALIERDFNKEVINLGFCGNGKFEQEIVKYIMTSNPSFIILDCTPNSSENIIRENLPENINYITSINDTVPIMLVESIMRDFAFFKKDDENTFGTKSYINKQNKALREVYKDIIAKRKKIYYVKSENFIGQDHEATIDGTHFNDLGHYRAYKLLRQEIKKSRHK